jgi:hypothetical protein
MLLLVYDTARFGGELYGPAGAWAPVLLFILIEALLVWTPGRKTTDDEPKG